MVSDVTSPTEDALEVLPETGTGAMRLDLTRRLAAEALGSAFLIVAVVGSGIMASRLSPDDVGLQLLENAGATAGALIGLILMFGAVSGAHFNPVVTLVDRLLGSIRTIDAALYVVAQTIGASAGSLIANAMFERPLFELSTKSRSSGALWLSEVVATIGLLLVIHGCVRTGRERVVPFAVGAWIGSAYFFTASTSFANPAVTVARTLSDSFAGIEPASAPMFIAMQLVGGAIAYGLVRLFYPQPIPTPPTDRRHQEPAMPASDQPLDVRAALRTAARRLGEEFDGTFSTETIQQFLETSFDQFAGQATVTTFLPLLSERFARQRLHALAKVEGNSDDGRPVVLFLCVHNAGRSQMALGWFTHLAGDRAVVWSGGSEPGSQVNPSAVAAMAEVGIDISREYPEPWTEEVVQAADVVVTMGCGDACPLFPGTRYEDWDLEDPAGHDVHAVRPIRDDIRTRVEALLVSLEVPVG